MRNWYLTATLPFLLLPYEAHAQAQQAQVVANCGTVNSTYNPGTPAVVTQDTTGKECVNATAQFTGFTPTPSYTTLTATGSSSTSTALPTGPTVIFYNTGTVAVSCSIANSATATTNQDIIEPGGALVYTPAGITHGACIDQTGTTSNVVVLSGGAGTPTIASGQSGGGGISSTVTLAAGSALAGKVGIDQTTPGTTNGVSLAQVGAATISTGTGAQGAGTPRVTVATDTATVAGSAPGTAGTASANVLTVQGIASMTKLLVTPDALPANQSVNVSQIGGTTVAQTSGTLAVNIGNNGTVVNNGGSVAVSSGTIIGQNPLDFGFIVGTSTALRAVATINGTAAVTLAAATAALHGYLTDVTCTRTDTGTLMAELTLNDAISSTIPLPPTGGATVQRRVAFISNGTNTAITGTSTAGVTGHCDAAGYTGTWLNDDLPEFALPNLAGREHLAFLNDLNSGRVSI